MDAFEFNKIAGAVLGTALGVMALMIISEIIFAPPHDQEPGYVIAVAETVEEGAEAGAAPEVEPIAARLQTASVDAGMNAAKKCQACHTFEQGGPAKVGPNLWGVVGGPVAHSESFGYSDEFREKAAEGMTWTYDNLDAFLTNPRSDMPGTAMAFAGLKKPEERADVIAYLRSLSDNPEPLPPPPDAETAAAGDSGSEATDSAAEADHADEQPATSDAGSTATETDSPSAAAAPSDAHAEPTTSKGAAAAEPSNEAPAQSADEASDAASGEPSGAARDDAPSSAADEGSVTDTPAADAEASTGTLAPTEESETETQNEP